MGREPPNSIPLKHPNSPTSPTSPAPPDVPSKLLLPPLTTDDDRPTPNVNLRAASHPVAPDSAPSGHVPPRLGIERH
ncbi:uncharacterized protein SPSK_00961 [Sporothrix schenckii 1099-18]|uniref:Uncharacterized protein n=1 Tax=Sporothrix schenckii 1099-18 TaxID=1397361 RepID=A0A0F2LWL4_SPOSC|nr:uncharacterized protein SPSK_00961 [Sporothrix schenckii 1099-18]KJR81862.1 hypothetical protein SPSK_00961 [Sporothrix schenckii 1099-18]